MRSNRDTQLKRNQQSYYVTCTLRYWKHAKSVVGVKINVCY